jgi:hypothetical protein
VKVEEDRTLLPSHPSSPERSSRVNRRESSSSSGASSTTLGCTEGKPVNLDDRKLYRFGDPSRSPTPGPSRIKKEEPDDCVLVNAKKEEQDLDTIPLITPNASPDDQRKKRSLTPEVVKREEQEESVRKLKSARRVRQKVTRHG